MRSSFLYHLTGHSLNVLNRRLALPRRRSEIPKGKLMPSRLKPQRVNASRRQFLQTAAGATAGAVFLGFPAILRATNKAGTKPVIVGTGDHSYEWIDNWAKLPAGKRFGNTHAVVETADGHILIHNASPTGDVTCAFDADGNFISSWGQSFGKEFAKNAHGMDLRAEGGIEFLYLTPTGTHKVYKTTLAGEVVLELDYPKLARTVKDGQVIPDYDGPAKFVPTFTAFSPAGDFYVTDGYGSNFVHRYTAKGEYLQSWGGKGSAPGQFNCPHGIWCDTRGGGEPLILVADRANVRLQWFTLDGQFVKAVTDELRHPCHFDQHGTDLLIPDLKGRVTLFDKDNKLITHLGDNPDPKQRANNGVKPADLQPGIFCTPHSARFDRDGNIYVVEWLPYGRVTKLKKING